MWATSSHSWLCLPSAGSLRWRHPTLSSCCLLPLPSLSGESLPGKEIIYFVMHSYLTSWTCDLGFSVTSSVLCCLFICMSVCLCLYLCVLSFSADLFLMWHFSCCMPVVFRKVCSCWCHWFRSFTEHLEFGFDFKILYNVQMKKAIQCWLCPGLVNIKFN